MHLNVLNDNQKALLPILKDFKKQFFMVGGTAIALHIGHRLSIDFDMFKKGSFKPKAILEKFSNKNETIFVTLNRTGQLNLVCRDVKFTFFDFEYDVKHEILVENSILIPSLLDLAAMKAFALGMRSKWKDYVDLYFILKDYIDLKTISEKAKFYFGDLFSEKLFRGQLSYFVGIDYSEQVEYMPGFEVDDETVKAFLVEASLSGF